MELRSNTSFGSVPFVFYKFFSLNMYFFSIFFRAIRSAVWTHNGKASFFSISRGKRNFTSFVWIRFGKIAQNDRANFRSGNDNFEFFYCIRFDVDANLDWNMHMRISKLFCFRFIFNDFFYLFCSSAFYGRFYIYAFRKLNKF